MVQNILIEVMGTLAEEELRMRKKRQMEGIEIAKQQGKYKGRKPIQIDEKAFIDKYSRWKKGEITAVEAMRLLEIKANTFYRRVALYEKSGQINPVEAGRFIRVIHICDSLIKKSGEKLKLVSIG